MTAQQAVRETSRGWAIEVIKLLNKLKYRCMKHTECDNITHFCDRETDSCKFRVFNTGYPKAAEEVRKFL